MTITTTELATKRIALASALALKNDIANTANRYYLFAGKHVPFTDDDNPPSPNNTVAFSQYRVFDEMVFAKAITSADVAVMVKRNDWTANTFYPHYDDTVANLEDKKFFVVAPESSSYHVFLVLDNTGLPSVSKPLLSETSPSDDFYLKLDDSYQWKYLYTITQSEFVKFATDTHVPVFLNENVSENAVFGALDVIHVDFGGSNYNSYATGFFSDYAISGNTLVYALDSTAASNTNFYNGCSIYIKSGTGAGQLRQINSYVISGTQKRVVIDAPFSPQPDGTSQYEITPSVSISGDGSGAKARAIVNSVSNTISRIEVLSKGNSYTFATATVVGNTGLVNVVSNTTIVANAAVLRPIIPPYGGHGANNYMELMASDLGISVTFANTETGRIPVSNDYRTIGIIKNPFLANVGLTIASPNNTFSVGDLVVQTNSGATGKVSLVSNSTSIRLTDVKGVLETGSRVVSVANSSISANVTAISGQDEILIPTTGLLITITNNGVFGNGFSLDEKVSQGTATGYVAEANSTVVRLTSVRGNFQVSSDPLVGNTSSATATVTSVIRPENVPYSGELIYVANMIQVTRAANQSETTKLILSF